MEYAIKVLIVSSNRLLRDSLACELANQTYITVLPGVSRALDISQRTLEQFPDVIITDFSSLKADLIVNASQIGAAYREAKLLVIGLNESQSELLKCIEAGALGCLSLEASLEDLHYHIRAVAAGGALCSPQVTKFLFSMITENVSEKERLQALNLTPLTRRERQIVALIEEGLSNKEIADDLKIELQTVKNHVHNILEKLQLSNRREAAKYAREERLVSSQAEVPIGQLNG